MAAVVATHQAPWREALRVQPAPQLGPPPAGCLQVDVVAAGLAFPDVLRIEGKHFHRPEYPFVPCQEVAGQVRAVGEGVEGWKVGQRVFGTVSTGALSPIAHMDARGAYPIPDRVSDEIAAGFELNYGTAFHSIHDLATARPGERLLVLGAGGGVGMAAVDIGQALGLEVVACASSDEKLAACSAAGASTLVKYGDDAASGDFKTALKNAGVYGAVDIVLDPVGGGYSEVALRSMGWGGRFVVVGFAAGGTTPDSAIPRLPLNHVLLNERQILGCFWGPWKERDRNALNRQHMATMMDMVQKGQLRPLVSHACPLREYAQAMSLLMGRGVVGKVVIKLPSASL